MYPSKYRYIFFVFSKYWTENDFLLYWIFLGSNLSLFWSKYDHFYSVFSTFLMKNICSTVKKYTKISEWILFDMKTSIPMRKKKLLRGIDHKKIKTIFHKNRNYEIMKDIIKILSYQKYWIEPFYMIPFSDLKKSMFSLHSNVLNVFKIWTQRWPKLP